MKIFAFISLCFFALALRAEEPLPDELKDIAIAPKMGTVLPLDEEFIDEAGKSVPLRSFFDGKKPVVLILNYYGCPMLCGVMLNTARDSFSDLDWLPGDHYRIVTISIDPTEEFSLAAAKKKSILGSIEKPAFRKAAETNWHFLVGKKGSEARVAKAVGFGYKWVEEEKQYAHGAALFLHSPDGKLSRVLQGLSYPPLDLKLGLLEAGEGKVGTFAEKLLSFCYHYEPKEKKFALLASRLVSLGGALTVFVMLLAYGVWLLRTKRKGNACFLCL